MRLIDAEVLEKIKFHPLPYTHIVPSDTDAESYKRGWNDAIDAIIDNAPSAQPEIIRCKDCMHNHDCNIQYHAQAGEEFYCGAAERRNDEQDD